VRQIMTPLSLGKRLEGMVREKEEDVLAFA
jgi:hypothetical protein